MKVIIEVKTIHLVKTGNVLTERTGTKYSCMVPIENGTFETQARIAERQALLELADTLKEAAEGM